MSLCASGGNPLTSKHGSYLYWQEPTQTFYLDQGPLGTLDEKTAQQLVIDAFQEWSNVEYSDFRWEFGGILEENVTVENATRYIESATDGINLVIFDEDGSIIDSKYGIGMSDSVLGFAYPVSSPSGVILSAKAILNGKLLTRDGDDLERIYASILHEIGHFTGLDHTQLYPEFAFDEDPDNDRFIPVMFPLAPREVKNPQGLSADDKMTIASLYQSDDFYDDLGGIFGTVTRPDGTAVQGANVVAVNVEQPYTLAYSVVSDLSQSQTGEFQLSGIQPGNYVLYIEPIHPEFHGLSGVGPFSDHEDSPSFINPVIKEYYNSDRESGSSTGDDPEDQVIIEVNAGEEITNIHFVSNEDDSSAVSEWCLF
ncbi:MAG: hypothetical protein ACOX5R_20425 [bacterium]